MKLLESPKETKKYEPKKHTLHVYERSNKTKTIYRCIDPYCSHYQALEYLIGKVAECPKCGTEFILTKILLKNKLPTCFLCSKSPKKMKDTTLGKDVMEEILKELNKVEKEK